MEAASVGARLHAFLRACVGRSLRRAPKPPTFSTETQRDVAYAPLRVIRCRISPPQRLLSDRMDRLETFALLSEYVENGSETAFREIVRRHIDLVYSVALRRVSNSVHASPTDLAVSTASKSLTCAGDAAMQLSSWSSGVNVTTAAMLLVSGIGLGVFLLQSPKRTNLRGETPSVVATETPQPAVASEVIDENSSTAPPASVGASTQVLGANNRQTNRGSRSVVSSLKMSHPILQQMADAYAACLTYRDEGHVERVHTGRPAYVTSFKTVFVRPNRFRSEFKDSNGKDSIVWRDGETVRRWFAPVVPHIVNGETFEKALMQYVAAMSSQLVHLPGLLSPEWSALNIHLTDFVVREPLGDEKVEGIDCFRLIGGVASGMALTLWIDKQTLLLRRIYTDGRPRGVPIQTTTTFRPVVDSEILEEELQFRPPGANSSR